MDNETSGSRAESTNDKLPRRGNAPYFRDGDTALSGGFISNLKEYFRSGPKIARGAAASRMSVDWQPRHRTLWRNLRDAISPPKLPPLKVTSRPVKVQPIWSRDAAFAPSQGISLAVHILLIAMLGLPLINRVVRGTPPAARADGPLIFEPFTARAPAFNVPQGGGSGGNHDPIPASAGRAPAFANIQIAPPSVVLRNLNPAMSAVPTVIGPPDLTIQNPPLSNYGDPLALAVTSSNGPGGNSGIGDHNGSGIGDGAGPGIGSGWNGGTGGHRYSAGGVNYPTCVYCPPAKYSEEARKAKFQGTVTLQVLVTPDGRGTDIEVVKGLGMGLDEQAIEAVKGWKFRPAYGADGKPVATVIGIEVMFRLL
jgi:periplasmic protein TonB